MTQYANRREAWHETPSPTILLWHPGSWRSSTISLSQTICVSDLIDYISRDWTTTFTFNYDALISRFVSYSIYGGKEWEITQSDIPDGEPYQIIRPIPVKIEDDNEIEFTATFEAANIAIGGETPQDSFRWIVLEVLDTLDSLLSHGETLGPDAEKQLHTLSHYIVKADNASR